MNKTPVKTQKRIELLDVFRGFAILGIFVVNIVIMNSTFLNQDVFAKQWTATVDIMTQKVLQLFFYTKFFPIFSLLFGLGISMQVLKMIESHKLSFSFFARRMFVLFIFGLLHIILLWSGDVLHIYAILGLLTIFFIKKSNALLLTLSGILLFFPFYDQCFTFLFNVINFTPEIYLSDYTGETVNTVIKNGTYAQGIQLRYLEYLSNIPMLVGFLAPIALSMFLLGLYLGKNKIYNTLDTFITQIKKPMILITIVTNLYRVSFLFFLTDLEIYKNEVIRSLLIKLMVVSDVVMGLFYLWGIGWLWYHTTLKRILSPIQYAGRMALTNYIMHSIIGVLLFTSIGFRLYETLSPSQALLVAMIVFIIQIILSKIWLSYFKFGPLEWVWRCFTYKKLLSIKRSDV